MPVLILHQVILYCKGAMGRIMLFILATVVISGCKPESKPEGVLPEPEMIKLLMQLYLADEQFSKISIPYDSSTKLIPIFREKVFQRAGVADSVYRISMEYYLNHPRQLEYIYTALVDSLSLQEQSKPNEYSPYAPSQ